MLRSERPPPRLCRWPLSLLQPYPGAALQLSDHRQTRALRSLTLCSWKFLSLPLSSFSWESHYFSMTLPKATCCLWSVWTNSLLYTHGSLVYFCICSPSYLLFLSEHVVVRPNTSWGLRDEHPCLVWVRMETSVGNKCHFIHCFLTRKKQQIFTEHQPSKSLGLCIEPQRHRFCASEAYSLVGKISV